MRGSRRPLSPHLQVYRPQLTSILSVLHRMTGLLLAGGTIIIAAWIIALSMGFDAFSIYQGWLKSVFGKLLLIGWSFSMFYHLLNGVRHLFWDAGLGFRIERTYQSGWLVILSSVSFTLALWLWPVFK